MGVSINEIQFKIDKNIDKFTIQELMLVTETIET